MAARRARAAVTGALFMGALAATACAKVGGHCDSDPCRNGGRCIDAVDAAYCACPPGFEGTECEIEHDECNPNPCENGGVCTEAAAGFTCGCAGGYTGTTCALPPDACLANPCENGGVCVATGGDFACLCAAGFDGPTCAHERDECAGAPCHNGGVCSDAVDGFSCQCSTGFGGTTCDEDVDECAGSPCANGGVCVNEPGTYSCVCPWQSADPACACARGGPAQHVDFKALGTFSTLAYVTPSFTIRGSSTLSFLNLNGFGVSGNFDNQVDGNEWFEVTLAVPGFPSYAPFVTSNGNLNALLGEAEIAAWGSAGEYLGAVSVSGSAAKDVSDLFAGALVTRFVVSAKFGDGAEVGAMDFDPCE